MATQYAAYDTERVIWGVGRTAAEARSDAEKWIGDGLHGSDQVVASGLAVAPCTSELVENVRTCGGQVDWRWGEDRTMELAD